LGCIFRFDALSPAAVIASGYSVGKHSKRCFEDAPGAQSFRCVGKDFRTALSTDSRDCRHIWTEISGLTFGRLLSGGVARLQRRRA
jgi:hypothetical protein